MLLLIIVSAFLLASCAGEKTAFVSYDLDLPVKTEVFSQGLYATMDGDVEEIGTITATTFSNEYSQDGELLFLERAFLFDKSEGYLKRSYPPELALRLPELRLKAKGMQVISIEGNENFDSAVVARLLIPDRWKRQISQKTRQIDLDRIEKRRWELTHILLGEVPLNSNITRLLVSQGRLPNIPNASIDSVLTRGVRRINGNRCIEYVVFLQEKELFPYFIWEQHVTTVKSGQPFKSYDHREAWYRTRYEIALNLENGIPCLEREYKFGTHGMQHPETGDSVVFRSQISNERLYTFLD
ncbi:MAG: hypothetical protein LBC85_05715 [Fibromonadaceae bacterium]|jgi:hypothetical protein|nr:hypothetical protein [Fibromonadaceae bacterium]